MIYKALIQDPELGKVWFGSLDGEAYYEINREPDDSDVDALKALIGSKRMKPLAMGRLYLRRNKAEFFDPVTP